MNPFSKDRYEHIPTHLYYLPQELVAKLEDSKPSYIIGSRGSGKTTLLKSLNWQERVRNKWLNQELGGNAFRGRFVACYTKLPLIQVRSFSAWLRQLGPSDDGAIFGFYLDLVSIENLAHSLSVIVSELLVDVTPRDETDAVSDFVNENDFLLEASTTSPSTIAECHQIIRNNRRLLEKVARAKAAPAEYLAENVVPEMGELSRSFCAHMGAMLDKSTDASDLDRWHFKFCFDEAECLDPLQSLTINTMIRTAEWPVSYVISFVGQPNDLSRTLHANLSAQSADRFIHLLDDLSRPDFEKLCDGVANVRIRAHLENTGEPLPQEPFRTSDVLGQLDLNVIIDELVRRSENTAAKALETEAEAFRTSPWVTGRPKESCPPYIEAYLANRLSLKAPPGDESDARRRQASQEFRKKFVATYLSICRELRVRKIPYAFSNMLFGISDSCVRDFLSQMYRIFEVSENSLTRFIETRVDWKTQSEAIRQASEEKKRSITIGTEVSKPENVRRLTECLGTLTAILQQGNRNSFAHLKSSERGVFQFTDGVSTADDEELYEILKDASEAGFIRLRKEGTRILGFRVHSSMAPAFGFSYRGAYYPVMLKKSEVTQMLDAAEDTAILKLSREVATRITDTAGDSAQMTLWPLKEEELDSLNANEL